ncbi:pilus assembly protein [Alteromonas sp. ASW11-19]|uniref:Pilus assembly protein n=1 Tax=Alteromonas salexigens TaxID=2982530 RepID=A0ABT2VNJ1_9ALTE|nr:TadE/TadG family type IV pilus assembly protein [Alteromonas salexigens]MCU7554872.1 pilus assembly protein [Alteromonas salexigens]
MPRITAFTHQRGVAVIEFTLIAPLLFFLIFATAEFGRLLYQYNALTNSVRDAGRYISDRAYQGNTGIPSLPDSLKTKTSNLIISGDTNGQSELLPGLAAADISYSLSGDWVTITVSYQWTPIFSDSLFSLTGDGGISLAFPMTVAYTMRASQ